MNGRKTATSGPTRRNFPRWPMPSGSRTLSTHLSSQVLPRVQWCLKWRSVTGGGRRFSLDAHIGVDFSPSCIGFCRKRFAHLTNVDFYNTDGRTLSLVLSDSVQFIWSFDSFVHIEPDITECYMAEFARILSPGGRFTIHHPGTPTRRQRANGGRSELSADLFARIANASGLQVRSQVDSWGPGNRSNTKLFADCISTIERPNGTTAKGVPKTVTADSVFKETKIEAFSSNGAHSSSP